MRKGDKVRWTSQSGGYTKDHEGEIVLVIPPDTSAIGAVQGIIPQLPRYVMGWGCARGHESYVVRSKGKLYWPLVSRLKTTELPRAVVVVRGGTCQAVYAAEPLKVVILDMDDLEDEARDDPEADPPDEVLKEAIAGLEMVY